ncbi:ATP-binding protein [Shewanella sp. 10N.286.51.B7]|uniref:ATP-binding protein n=1 Tax=Shewanella sp. 10N.286.51.B7 TaxID=1880836 RepID=UPI000C84FD5F|nr:ATP-binding protein [Shewanella sp. 10N.286.51.B7]
MNWLSTFKTQWLNKQARSNFLSGINSLKIRLMLSGLLLILVLLPLIGITVNGAFQHQITQSINNQLRAYVYSVLAVAEVKDEHVVMPNYLLENQFNVIGSGLYALISSEDKLVWHSESFLGLDLPTNQSTALLLPAPPMGQGQLTQVRFDDLAGNSNNNHVVYSFSVSFETNEKPLAITVHIVKDDADYQQQVSEFSTTLWTWLIVLMIVLALVQAIWLFWTLKPLNQFTKELALVEQGQQTRLNQHYPNELNAVAKQLNVLLNTEQLQRQRYRNALADLAHSLKTPLAVLQSQTDLSPDSKEQANNINNIISYQLNKAKSSANQAWHLGVSIDDVASKLIRTLAKIYQQSHIDIDYQAPAKLVFKGEEADLHELLGNLLDNACKAAKTQVCLSVTKTDSSLSFIIEDDGNGLTEVQRQNIFERGIRADTYNQGHGIGLAIVQDLVNSYQGELTVAQSEQYGGAKFTVTFSH